jgi:Tol biopolymer transport system component
MIQDTGIFWVASDNNPYANTEDPAVQIVSGGLNYCDAPLWSRDGKKIIFTSNNGVDGGYEIFSINPDGSGKTNLTQNASYDGYYDSEDYL